MSSIQLEIPQFVVIHDQEHNTYKHPVVHYVFDEEEFPNVPKDNMILVDLDATASQLTSVDSYSPNFQVTDCILEHGQLNDQFEEEASLLNLTIEGISGPSLKEAVEDPQPIRNVEELKEAIFNFKNRNDVIKKVFSQSIASSQSQQQDNNTSA